MTSPAPVFGRSGDYRARSGSTVQPVISVRNGDGTLLDLTDREVFYSFYDRQTEEELLTRSAVGVGSSVALPPITGDDHRKLREYASPLFLSILVGFYVDQGYVELSEGQVTIDVAPRTLVAAASDAPEQARLDVTMTTGALQVTMKGSPGYPAAQQLAQAGFIAAPTVEAMAEWQRAPAVEAALKVDNALAAQDVMITQGFAIVHDTYSVAQPTRGVAAGGEMSVPTPAPVPLDKPYWVDFFINGLLQTPGIHFTTNGTASLSLVGFTLDAGAAWLVRQYQRIPA